MSLESTLIVDEIPGRIVGNDDEPPGRILHLDGADEPIWDIHSLKMPYDATPLADGTYLVNIIRDKAVWQVTRSGDVVRRLPVGGYPCSHQLLANGNLLVAGWDYHLPGFVREFDTAASIVWRQEGLHWPWKADRLTNGNTLIADAGGNRVFEVTQRGAEVWSVNDIGPERPELFDALGPVYCQRLANGHTLVSVRGISQILEMTPDGEVVWEVGSELIAAQYSAIRLQNGNTLIADCGNHRVIEITPQKEIVWQRGGFGYPAKAYRLPLPNDS